MVLAHVQHAPAWPHSMKTQLPGASKQMKQAEREVCARGVTKEDLGEAKEVARRAEEEEEEEEEEAAAAEVGEAGGAKVPVKCASGAPAGGRPPRAGAEKAPEAPRGEKALAEVPAAAAAAATAAAEALALLGDTVAREGMRPSASVGTRLCWPCAMPVPAALPLLLLLPPP